VVPVLRDINLDVATGEFVALMGPSGSGKTTLLNLIAGIDKADGGTLRVDGVDIRTLSESDLAAWRAASVGFIFQFYNLLPVLTAFENVELPLLLTRLSARERREHVRAGLEMVGLSDRASHRPSELSGGQQQRVAVARALAGDPLILLADEPTGNLDSSNGEAVMDLLRELHQQGSTICMVTHDPRFARYAERTIHLFDGRVVEEKGSH